MNMEINKKINVLILASSIFLLCMISSVAADADWIAYKRADIRNKNKDLLRIERYGDGPAYLWLVFRNPVTGIFSTRLPLYKIDSTRVHDLEDIKNVVSNKSKDRWIKWEIYKGTGPAGNASIQSG